MNSFYFCGVQMRFVVLLAFSFVFASNAQAADFDAYVERLAEHPQVMQVLEQSERFREMADGEMGLPDPMLMLGAGNLPVNNPSFDREMMTSKMIGFSQAIPSYSLRKARSEKQQVLSAKQRLMGDYTIRRLKAMLIAMLAQHGQVKQQEDYARQQLGHYRELEDYFRGRMEAGGAVYWRFSEVDVDRSMVEQRLNDLKARRIDIEAELVRLVGEVPEIALPDIPQLTWNQRPDSLYPARIAREDVAAAEKDVNAAEAGYGPNYGISASYMQRDRVMGNNLDDMFTVQATISIPLWAHWNQQPKLRAAEAGKRSAAASYDDTLRQWTRQMTALASNRDTALANVHLLEEKDQALKAMVEAVERNYEAGKADLNTVLSARINRLNIRSGLAEQQARHVMLAAEYQSHLITGEEE